MVKWVKRATVTLTCVGVLALPIANQLAASAAEKTLGSIVLAKTLPGLVASAPGTTNGPIGDPGLHYLPMNNKSGNIMLEYLILRRVSGYVRAFSRKPPNGDGIFIFAFRYKHSSDEVSWLRGFNATFKSSGEARFVVSGVKGATGFVANTSTSAGAPLVTYTISFDVGLTTFIMITGTTSGDLTKSNAIALAKTQEARALSMT